MREDIKHEHYCSKNIIESLLYIGITKSVVWFLRTYKRQQITIDNTDYNVFEQKALQRSNEMILLHRINNFMQQIQFDLGVIIKKDLPGLGLNPSMSSTENKNIYKFLQNDNFDNCLNILDASFFNYVSKVNKKLPINKINTYLCIIYFGCLSRVEEDKKMCFFSTMIARKNMVSPITSMVPFIYDMDISSYMEKLFSCNLDLYVLLNSLFNKSILKKRNNDLPIQRLGKIDFRVKGLLSVAPLFDAIFNKKIEYSSDYCITSISLSAFIFGVITVLEKSVKYLDKKAEQYYFRRLIENSSNVTTVIEVNIGDKTLRQSLTLSSI